MDDINYKDIGRRIKVARKEKSMSQEKLAEAVGVNPTHISHIENGKGTPSVAVLIRIMNHLHIEPNWLFCGNVETTEATLLKETEMIFKGCSSKQIRRMNRMLADWKKAEEEL